MSFPARALKKTFFNADIVVETNQMWFSMVSTLINNDMHHFIFFALSLSSRKSTKAITACYFTPSPAVLELESNKLAL